MDLKIYFNCCKRLFNRCVFCTQPMILAVLCAGHRFNKEKSWRRSSFN